MLIICIQNTPLHIISIISPSVNGILAGADPGEGHRGQMTPPSETYQGSQKMMYLYENNEFKLSFQYFYKIKTVYLLRIFTHHTPCSMHRVWSSGGWTAT